jgi:hypothetical protein
MTRKRTDTLFPSIRTPYQHAALRHSGPEYQALMIHHHGYTSYLVIPEGGRRLCEWNLSRIPFRLI